jgi:hypothetical protein
LLFTRCAMEAKPRSLSLLDQVVCDRRERLGEEQVLLWFARLLSAKYLFRISYLNLSNLLVVGNQYSILSVIANLSVCPNSYQMF